MELKCSTSTSMTGLSNGLVPGSNVVFDGVGNRADVLGLVCRIVDVV